MADPLRILITADAARTPGGAAVPHAYATQIEFLRRAGHDVAVFGVDDRTSPGGVRRNLRELRIAILEFRPHLLAAYYGTMVAAVTRAAAGRIPFVVTFRGSDLLGTSNPGWQWRIRDRLGRVLSLWAAGAARRIIVNGAGLLNALPARLQGKARNIPNGINMEIFAPCPPAEARGQLGWDLHEKLILFNAGIDSGQVVKNRPLAEAAIARSGARLEAISTCTREEVALRMNACDCLLVTSLHEGSPDLVKEAMACNLPVVSVPCGDMPERLAGVTPGGVRPYDAAQLADLLGEVLQEGARSNGRARLFEQGLDAASVAGRVAQVYQEAAG